jgi:hypothetical protein
MKQQWYIRREGQVYGPYTQNTLNVLSVLPTDELGQAPQGPWKTASAFPSFGTRSNLSDTNSQLTQSSPQSTGQTTSNPSPMQLAIHRDNESGGNESGGNNKVLQGCSIGCLVVILIGVVVLLVALSLLGQAIDGFFEGVRDFFEHPLNPFSWF